MRGGAPPFRKRRGWRRRGRSLVYAAAGAASAAVVRHDHRHQHATSPAASSGARAPATPMLDITPVPRSTTTLLLLPLWGVRASWVAPDLGNHMPSPRRASPRSEQCVYTAQCHARPLHPTTLSTTSTPRRGDGSDNRALAFDGGDGRVRMLPVRPRHAGLSTAVLACMKRKAPSTQSMQHSRVPAAGCPRYIPQNFSSVLVRPATRATVTTIVLAAGFVALTPEQQA